MSDGTGQGVADVVLSLVGLGMIALIGFAVHLILERIDQMGKEIGQLRVHVQRMADSILIADMRITAIEQYLKLPGAPQRPGGHLWPYQSLQPPEAPTEGS